MSSSLAMIERVPLPERVMLRAASAARVAGISVCSLARWRAQLRAELTPAGHWLYPLEELRTFFGVQQSGEALAVLECPGCVRAIDAHWSRAYHTCRRPRPSPELTAARGALVDVLLRRPEGPAPGSDR
jgi:hypothetical protein